jgi:predicted O-methyltransferase YrrM
VLGELRYVLALRALPPRVAWFVFRSRRVAQRTGDQFTLRSATRPRDLATLLECARGRRHVVELGTGTAVTTIALAVADPERTITSYDPIDRPERERYLALAGVDTRARIELINAPGADGPRSERPVEMLYVDSSHMRQDTIDEFNAWKAALEPGASIVFDDYMHPDFPGVREAVEELGLRGEQRGTMFVAFA